MLANLLAKAGIKMKLNAILTAQSELGRQRVLRVGYQKQICD